MGELILALLIPAPALAPPWFPLPAELPALPAAAAELPVPSGTGKDAMYAAEYAKPLIGYLLYLLARLYQPHPA